MRFRHDCLKLGDFLRVVRTQVCCLSRVGGEVVQLVFVVVAADVQMNKFPFAFPDGLAASKLLKLKVKPFVLFLHSLVLQGRKQTDAVHVFKILFLGPVELA